MLLTALGAVAGWPNFDPQTIAVGDAVDGSLGLPAAELCVGQHGCE